MKKIVTSESVNIGHPDKTCDVIADAFLDAALSQDPNAQMAVECAIKNNKLFVYGEATTTANVDYRKIATEVLSEIGYTQPFDIVLELSQQSPDINQAVVKQKLCANVVAQIVAFACGKEDDDKNKNFKGGRPSSIIIGDKLTPASLGALLAHFENKVMFQGFTWNVNSFDQEGVQLGKVLAKKVLAHDTDGALKEYADLLNI